MERETRFPVGVQPASLGQQILLGRCDDWHMKMGSLLALALPLLVLGCKREPASAPASQGESKTYSDGGSTWKVGAVTMNGTNVALTNVSVHALTNKVSP
jgi:hypothetical protein